MPIKKKMDDESSRAFWEFIDRRGKEVADSYPAWLRRMLPAPPEPEAPKSAEDNDAQTRTLR